ncbi:hypothetical protein VUR80DRAFT_5648 [Thermomyces stellatus]
MRTSVATWAAALLALPATLSRASGVTARLEARQDDVACNNSPDLCGRKYSEVTHLGGHNSAFVRDDTTDDSIAGNQYFNATRALDAGLRLLQAQVHYENGTLRLCHSLCSLLDAGPLEDWLGAIKSWMDNNQNDVVTVLLVNSDEREASEFGRAFEGSGLGEYGYEPSGDDKKSWPTLAKMINDNKRLVAFVTNIAESTEYPYILDEFTYVFETPFEVTSPSGFNCTADRPSNLESGTAAINDGMLPLMNHFLYQDLGGSLGIMIPDVGEIGNTNSDGNSKEGQLGRHAAKCKREWNQNPTFILVDFFDEGNTLGVADSLNGIKSTEGREDPQSRAAVATGRGTAMGALAASVMAASLLF